MLLYSRAARHECVGLNEKESEHAQLIEREEGEGVIEFLRKHRPNELPMISQLLPNNDSIWRMAFMPIH